MMGGGVFLQAVALLALSAAATCGASTAAATTKLRIVYRPNTTALSPIDQDWTITYLLRPTAARIVANGCLECAGISVG
jgi:hypothetical protein